MLIASAETAQPPSDLTEQGRGQRPSSSGITAAEVLAAIRDLRAVVNPDVRVDMLVRIVINHAPDDPDVVVLALAEVERARCSPQTRRAALTQLQPVKTSLWRRAQTPPTPQVQTGVNPSAPALDVRLDPELGRLAIGLHSAAHLRLWAVGRYLSSKRHSGRGWLDLGDFWAALAPLGVAYTRRHFRRLLRSGAGVFWTTTHNRVYFTGVQKVAARLACQATLQPDLTATNRPGGMKDVYLPVDGPLERWEGLIYAGWLAAKGDPVIARDTLAALFGRTAKTIRQWERDRLGQVVRIRPCYAQVADPQAHAAYIPEHSYAYTASVREPGGWFTRQEIHIGWQLPNAYISTIRQHPRKGQSRKVRTATNTALESQPPDGTAGGMQRHPRRYFENAKQLQRLVRRHGAGQGGRYLFLGRNRCDHNVFEPTQDGYPATRADERVKARWERWMLA